MKKETLEELLKRGAIIPEDKKFSITGQGLLLLASDLEQELLERQGSLTEAQRKGIKDIQDGIKSPEFLYLLYWWESLE